MPRRRRPLRTYKDIAERLGKDGIGVYGPAAAAPDGRPQPTSYRWNCGCAALAGDTPERYLWIVCTPHEDLRG